MKYTKMKTKTIINCKTKMKAKLIITGICIVMNMINNNTSNAQESSSNYFENESWSLPHQLHVSAASASETIYFSTENRFFRILTWSSGVYIINCSSGTYLYNPSDKKIILNIEDKYRNGHVGGGPQADFTKSTDTIDIISITDSVAIVADIRVLLPHKEFRRQREDNENMFVMPGVDVMFTVGQVKLRKHHSDLILIEDNDQLEILKIIRSARYDRIENTKENLYRKKHLYQNDSYTINIQSSEAFLPASIGILVNESCKNRLLVISWDGLWYEIEESAYNRLIEIFEKYIQ